MRARRGVLLAAGLVLAAEIAVGSTSYDEARAVDHGVALTAAHPRFYRARPVRIVQANLRSNQSVRHFRADVAKVLRQHPDVVTYNEVAYRRDGALAPGRYRVWRSSGKYRGETAVAWDSSRWRLMLHGTTMLSHQRGRGSGQQVQWGIRYANWVVLRNRRDHRVVSVVAAHVAPQSKRTARLLGVSVRRLGRLARALARHGTVLVGGDFNVGYRSHRYPRRELTHARLVPTYDVTGRRLATGDHHDATIDYVFIRGVARYVVGGQRRVALHSDHAAVLADLRPLPISRYTRGVRFGRGAILSDPDSGYAGRTVLRRTVLSAIGNAPRHASIYLATRHLTDRAIGGALRAAHRRGVHVRVILGARAVTRAERTLARALGSTRRDSSWVVRRSLRGFPVTRVLVSRTGAASRLRVTLPVGLTSRLVSGSRRATLESRAASYGAFRRAFMRVARQP